MQRKTKSKILSLFLSLCLILGMVPMTAFAQGDTPLGDSGGTATPSGATPTDIVIAAFDEVDEDVLYQGYDFGEITSQSALNLPDALSGMDEDGEAVTIGGVTWQSEPAFDGAVSQSYEFAPTLPKGYSTAEGVTAPVITVVIRPEGGAQIQPFVAAGSTMTIGGQTNVDLTTNQTGTGWAWNASTDTLTLGSTYTGERIYINCAASDTIRLVYSGNVSVSDSSFYNAIHCAGNLIIKGTSDTLNVTALGCAIYAVGDLEISSGTVDASVTQPYGRAISSQDGDVTISGSANVTAASLQGEGIGAQSGDITISTSGSVNATGDQYAIIADITTITNGSVDLSGSATPPNDSITTVITGGTVTYNGGTAPTISALSPNTGSVTGGTSVTLSGTDLTGVTKVWIGGALATGVTANTATSVTFTTPTGSAGAVDVMVETDDGICGQSNGFTYMGGSTGPAMLGIPDNLAWDSTTPGKATWDAVNNASNYTVQLYLNNNLVVFGVTAGTDYDFTPDIAVSGAGTYTFNVRAIGDGINWSDSPWTLPGPGYAYTPGGTQPPTVTGTMDIGGTSINLNASDDRLASSGWAWDATTATLTLSSGYVSSNAIFVNCATTDTINLDYSGNVNISVAGTAFKCKGALNINGSGTLTLENTTQDNYALQAINGDLNISGGTLNATGPIGIYSDKGDTIIGGSANVTAVSTGNSMGTSAGICANDGYDISITGGTVNATGIGTGQYDGALLADNITITGGDVNLFADIPSNYAIAAGGSLSVLNPADVKIDGTQVYFATVTLSGVNTETPVAAVTSPASGYGIASMTTNANGELYFLLPVGETVTIEAADGKTYSGTVNVTGNHGATAILTPGGGSIGTQSSISGTIKGNDTNSGINGATVQLKDASGGLPVTVATNASGQYSFDYLPAGTYHIEASAAGYSSGTLSNIVLGSSHISGKDITLIKTGGVQPGNTYPTILGIPVTDINKDNITGPGINGGVRYDPATKTLTLENAVIAYDTFVTDGTAISAEDDITIRLIGQNQLGKVLGDFGNSNSYTTDTGILSTHGVTLSGGGSLTIYDLTYGIYSQGDGINIDIGGSLTVAEYGTGRACCLKSDAGPIVITRGNLNLTSQISNAIYGSIGTVINGGSITIWAYNKSNNSSFAFLNEPTFGSSYSHKVFAGANAASAVEIPNPTATTFTGSNYVRIEPSTAGGGGGGNGGGGGGSSTPDSSKAVTTDKKIDQPVIAKQEVKATVDKDGRAAVTITESQIKTLVDKAKATGTTADGIGIAINVTFGTDGKSAEIKLNEKALALLVSSGAERFEVSTPLGGFIFDKAAIKEMSTQASGAVTFSITPVTKLSDAAKALIGNRPVFDFTVSYVKNGKTETISNFGKGTVSLAITYKAVAGEKTGNLYGVYVDGNGKPQLLQNSSYDNGKVIFSRSSLSVYGVGYKASADFTDTTGHWAKDNIDFVVSRGLLSGTTATTFAPDTAITRADFLMALGKLSGADVSVYKQSSFTDVKSTDAAMPYIEWAYKNGIVSGTGNNQFSPNATITREQMAVMMQNYAKAAGFAIPVSRQYNAFADDAKINTWATSAVKAIAQAGIIVGKDGNKFDPQGNATRAEASTILRRFVELVIDEGTSRGWVKNDSGSWMYYDWQGKRITGWLPVTNSDAKYYLDSNGLMVSGKWLQIDGKWYYFYADGKMARSATVEGYTIGEDGARKDQ